MPKIARSRRLLFAAVAVLLTPAGHPSVCSGQGVPFRLSVRPKRVSARQRQPVYVRVYLRNVTSGARRISAWMMPVPLADEGKGRWALKMYCVNARTNTEVNYLYPIRDVKLKTDYLRMELPETIKAHRAVHATLNMVQFCILPVGDYVLTLQYDTSRIGASVRPDKRAWHGVTNTATVRIHVRQ